MDGGSCFKDFTNAVIVESNSLLSGDTVKKSHNNLNYHQKLII